MNPIFIHLTSTASTNSFLLDLAQSQNVENHVAYTDCQTHGKGLASNIWESEPLKNLTFSIALDSSFLKISEQFTMSKAVAVALHQCLSNYIDENKLYIKWPNDILFDNCKLSGVLISNLLKNNCMALSIIGIGINVNQTLFHDWPTHPISMKMISGSCFDLEQLLHNLVDKILITIESLQSGLYHQINGYYVSKLFRYQQWGKYLIGEDEKEMFMEGLDNYGRLLLRDHNSKDYVFDVKEIKFVM